MQQIEKFENASNNHLSDLIKYPQDPLVTAIIMPASDEKEERYRLHQCMQFSSTIYPE